MSNQVFSDLTNKYYYFGRDFSFTLTFHGDADPTKTITVGARTSRANENDFIISFTTSQVLDWGPVSTSMVAPDGSLPENYRPGVNQQFLCWIPSTTNPFTPGKLFPAYVIVGTGGSMTIRKIDVATGDPAPLSPAGALAGTPIMTIYYEGPA